MHSLPNMAKPSGKSTRHEMEYYDGHRRIVYTVDEGYSQNDGTISSRAPMPTASSPMPTASSWKSAATANANSSARRTTSSATPTCPKPPSKTCGTPSSKAKNGTAT